MKNTLTFFSMFLALAVSAQSTKRLNYNNYNSRKADTIFVGKEYNLIHKEFSIELQENKFSKGYSWAQSPLNSKLVKYVKTKIIAPPFDGSVGVPYQRFFIYHLTGKTGTFNIKLALSRERGPIETRVYKFVIMPKR